MIGDNPIVIGLVLLFIAAFLASKGLGRRDQHRCPSCKSLSVEWGDEVPGTSARFVECRRCANPLVRDASGRLHERVAWLDKHVPKPSNKLGLRPEANDVLAAVDAPAKRAAKPTTNKLGLLASDDEAKSG